MGLRVADEQQVRLPDAHLFQASGKVFRAEQVPETVLDAVVDDLDLLRRNIEVVENVAARVLGHGDDPVGSTDAVAEHALGVERRRAVRQEARVEQVNDVVDRDHRWTRHDRRQDVVRGVVEVQARPRDAPGHHPDLAQRVDRRPFHDAAEVRRQVDGEVAILGPDEEDVLIGDRLLFGLEPGETVDQVRDVHADPEVADLSGIDADSGHGASLTGRVTPRVLRRPLPAPALTVAATIRSLSCLCGCT